MKNLTLISQVLGLGLVTEVLGPGLGLGIRVLGLGLEAQVLVNITAHYHISVAVFQHFKHESVVQTPDVFFQQNHV